MHILLEQRLSILTGVHSPRTRLGGLTRGAIAKSVLGRPRGGMKIVEYSRQIGSGNPFSAIRAGRGVLRVRRAADFFAPGLRRRTESRLLVGRRRCDLPLRRRAHHSEHSSSLRQGEISVYDGLNQPRGWLCDVTHQGQLAAYQRVDFEAIPKVRWPLIWTRAWPLPL